MAPTPLELLVGSSAWQRGFASPPPPLFYSFFPLKCPARIRISARVSGVYSFFPPLFLSSPFTGKGEKKKRTIPKVALAPRGRPRSPSPSPRLCLADLGGICPRRLAACPQPSPATGGAWKGAAARGRVGRGGQRGPGRPEGLFHPCTSPCPPSSPRRQLCASSLPLLVLGVPQDLKGALGFPAPASFLEQPGSRWVP